jgi:hypothetical protein
MAEPVPAIRLAPRIHADVIGDEALVISFETGKYYTIRGTGADLIRSLVVGPVHEDQIRDALEADFPEESSFIRELRRTEIEGFMATLLSERLVERAFCDKKTHVAFTGSYGFQQLEVMDDLADLLLIDPIHDVTGSGWPNKSS